MRMRFVVLGALALLPLAPVVRVAAQSACDDDRRLPAPQLGFGLFQCVGGACGIYDGPPGAREHRFTVEPRLWHIAHPGPADRLLEEGDQLVSVDGVPVTTRRAGQRLARLAASEPLVLTVRRAGALVTVRIVPEIGCGYPMLVVTETSALPPGLGVAPAAPRPAVAPFELGLTLACDDCRWVRRYDGSLAWQTLEVPRVMAIDANGPAARGGLAIGDLLLTIDGRALVTEAGGRYLGAVRPGQRIEIAYSRDGSTRTAHLTTGVPPAHR
jgi:hypothetical protein